VTRRGDVARALQRAATSACFIALAVLPFNCTQDRWGAGQAPVYDADVAPILQAHCVSCHGDSAPAAGWSATSFLGAIGCVSPSGNAATLPRDATAPVVAAMGEPPHQGLLSPGDLATISAWVVGGSPAFAAAVHTPDIVDPRSPGWHGALLREARWAPMLDGENPNACGRCHDGATSRPAGVSLPAPGAPDCTSCHTEPGGPLACSTCHGDGARTYPPRDPCFFPADAPAGAHAVHVNPSAARSSGLPCSTCHPLPPPQVIGGLHGNGIVDVLFDPTLVAPGGSYDATTGACTVSCHNLGGARPIPRWSDTAPLGCGDCHGSPPANHYLGPCTNCHREANAAGTALSGGPLHLNGRVDLGDGTGGCGACHGSGDDPWPATGAHPSHETPSIAAPIACSSCHVVPATVLDPTHLDGTVHVIFSGLALARGAQPSWDGTSCVAVACHGANLADPPATPAWQDTSGAQAVCGACHGIPPAQHTPSTSCDRATCHGSEVVEDATGRPLITQGPSRALHVNGVIDLGE
jgi:predicted CxxxxCH...CXXCH cytochrome family protein